MKIIIYSLCAMLIAGCGGSSNTTNQRAVTNIAPPDVVIDGLSRTDQFAVAAAHAITKASTRNPEVLHSELIRAFAQQGRTYRLDISTRNANIALYATDDEFKSIEQSCYLRDKLPGQGYGVAVYEEDFVLNSLNERKGSSAAIEEVVNKVVGQLSRHFICWEGIYTVDIVIATPRIVAHREMITSRRKPQKIVNRLTEADVNDVVENNVQSRNNAIQREEQRLANYDGPRDCILEHYRPGTTESAYATINGAYYSPRPGNSIPICSQSTLNKIKAQSTGVPLLDAALGASRIVKGAIDVGTELLDE